VPQVIQRENHDLAVARVAEQTLQPLTEAAYKALARVPWHPSPPPGDG